MLPRTFDSIRNSNKPQGIDIRLFPFEVRRI